MKKLCFVKHKSFQRKMNELVLRSHIQKFRGRKRNFEHQISDAPEETESPPKNCWKFLPKGDLPGIEKQYKKLRSIKLLLEL